MKLRAFFHWFQYWENVVRSKRSFITGGRYITMFNAVWSRIWKVKDNDKKIPHPSIHFNNMKTFEQNMGVVR